MSPHAKRKLIHYWRRQIRPVVILIVVFITCRSILTDWNDVPSGSMRTTIIEGDRIYVNKLAYGLRFPFSSWYLTHWNLPARGEIVVFDSPEDGIRLVKRVVGIPGDRIKVDGDQLTINGKRLEYEPVGFEVTSTIAPEERARFFYFKEHLGDHAHLIQIARYSENYRGNPYRDMPEFTVPEGKYFMMGDNRDNSKDGRFFNQTYGTPYNPDTACVELNHIYGRSSRTIFSLNRDNYWLPRSDRWLKGLP